MKQYDLCIITGNKHNELLGAFAIIIEDYVEKYFLVEIWKFADDRGAKIDSIEKENLRIATEEETEEFQRKFKEYCDKNSK